MQGMLAWLRQPTTVAGIAALVATLSARATAQLGWMQALPLIAGALISIALPDNTGMRQTAEVLARAIVAENNRHAGG